jgi:hypothetical protein
MLNRFRIPYHGGYVTLFSATAALQYNKHLVHVDLQHVPTLAGTVHLWHESSSSYNLLGSLVYTFNVVLWAIRPLQDEDHGLHTKSLKLGFCSTAVTIAASLWAFPTSTL